MSDLFRQRVSEFLESYIVTDGMPKYRGGFAAVTIKAWLKALIDMAVMTVEEMTQELLEYDVLLPPAMIIGWMDEIAATEMQTQ